MRISLSAGLSGAAAVLAINISTPVFAGDGPSVERGRYVTVIGGCNDCHTPNYPETGGKVPDKDWLMGNPIGFQGPWGTSYPANLRKLIAGLTEDEWLVRARIDRMPPMPSFTLRMMTDDDLRSIYRFVRSLGAAGVEAPAYVAPGGKPVTPYYVYVPVEPPK